MTEDPQATNTTEWTWGVLDGRTITFPMRVPHTNIATVLYTVPAHAAQALLPGEAFEVIEVGPGQAQMVVAACDYRDNPWGDYDELNLGFLARPRAAGDDVIGSFVYRMPVNQAFTCAAGNQVMGFPKTVEDIEVAYTADDVTFSLTCDGALALRLRVPRVAAPAGEAVRVATASYSYLDGMPHATTLEMDLGAPIEDLGAVHLELGSGAVADELRSLGLPAAPLYASWGEGLASAFHAPVRVW
jgi:hypothetical protein